MTFPGLGGQQPPPQNAAPAGQLVPGITPGVSGQIIATRVIIIGANGELLVYSPTPGAGNLIASVTGAQTTDPYGNTVLGGITTYASGAITEMFEGQVLLGRNITEITTQIPGNVALFGSSGGNGLQVQSDLEASSGTVATVFLISKNSSSESEIDLTAQHVVIGANGNGVWDDVSNTLAMAGIAVSAQSFTSTGDSSVEGSVLFVGNGTTAQVDLNPKQASPTNYPLNHISTVPTAAEFNAVVDCVNSAIADLVNIGLIA